MGLMTVFTCIVMEETETDKLKEKWKLVEECGGPNT